ncbi:MAG: FHA domain-containing protein, partial [Chloroflexota bacterium]
EDRGRERRGWHDHLVRSVVVDVRPAIDEIDTDQDGGARHIVNLTAMRLVPAPPLESVRTPERPELSTRRQPLPGDVTQPPPQRPPPAQQQQRPTPAPTRWRVHFDNGESFVIAGLALVGRRPEARNGEQVVHLIPLSSSDMSLSKTHAQFGPAPDGTIVVMDRGSTNGTVLVRQGVSRQLSPGKPASLVDGDMVVYGDRAMTLTREH